MKNEVTLTYWGIHLHNDFIYLSGIADEHPRLGVNAHIAHTSGIIKVTHISDDEFICETHNTNYKCNWKYVQIVKGIINAQCNVKDIPGCEILNKYGALLITCNNIPKDIEGIEKEEIDRIIQLAAIGKKELEEREIKEEEKLKELASNYENCIYIKLITISKGSKAAYHIGDEVGVINPFLHIGMFTDTVLYQKVVNDKPVDLRYYVGFNTMETYSWSDNIERVVIENIKGYDVVFNGKVIKSKETRVFERTW